MGKELTAAQVKKLPIGAEVMIIRERMGTSTLTQVIRSGRKKMLKGNAYVHEIKDRAGWRYEEVCE